MQLRALPHGPLAGTINVPGDKSISHRSLMFGALAVGTTRVVGLLEGADVHATAQALRLLGTEVERDGDGTWIVGGVGVSGLAEPEDVLDFGNAGTGARLMMGVLAGHPFTSFLTGDGSLRRRPMRRVLDPLMQMGASFIAHSGGRLPLALTGRSDLVPITYESPVASAQVKSAILLTGLHTSGITTVIEPARSRDHTERMLAGMGAVVETEAVAGGWRVSVHGHPELVPQDVVVPGDPSSAAFIAVAALTTPGSEVLIRAVGLNPLRTGLLETLREMGAAIEIANETVRAGEPVGDMLVRAGELRGVTVPAERAPRMIDEYPVLAVAATFAEGRTVMHGLGELRVKESDRLNGIARGLADCGARVSVDGDTLTVEGGRRPAGGATVDAHLDHRIAMSFLVMGGAAAAPVTVLGAETIDTSFPGFDRAMNALGARIDEVEEAA